MKRGVDWFLMGMVVAVGLAWALPGPGARGGALHPELLNKLGVALIFSLHGLSLSLASLKEGALKLRLHLLVQLSTYLLFPLAGLAVLGATRHVLNPSLRVGLFYLCALPSTVSSSVALTATARGNVPAAVFNATLSSLLGVVLTPLWLELVFGATGHTLPIGKVMLDLCLWLLLPFTLGQLLRPLLGTWASRRRASIGVVDRLTILMLVYTSFCDSVEQGVWSGQQLGVLAFTLVCSAGLLVSVLSLTSAASRALGFPVEDRIAAAFCGSKKTLASGVPMARLIFGADPGLGLILLPIMVYHPLQLIVCGWLAGRFAARDAPALAHETRA